MQQNSIPENHTLTIDSRKKVNITGIIGVDTFNDKQVQARLSSCVIHISGEGLTVNKFNTENGTLVVDGKINEIKYSDSSAIKAAGVFKKIFQ